MTETPNGTQTPQHATTPPQHPQHPQLPRLERHPHAGPEWRRPDVDTTGQTTPHPADPPGRSDGWTAAAAQDPSGTGQPSGWASPTGRSDAPAQDATGTGERSRWARHTGRIDPQVQDAGATGRDGQHGGWTGAPGAGGHRSGPAGWQPYQGAGPGPVGGGAGKGWQPYQGAGPGPAGGDAGTGWRPYASAGVTVATPERPRRAAGRRLVAVAALTAVLGGLVGGGAVAAFDGGPASTAVVAGGLLRDTTAAPATASSSGTVEDAAAKALASVVTLNVSGDQESGSGSGVIIRADGYILTNEHVVAAAGNGGNLTVTLPDGRTVPATVVGTDTATDLAVVKVAESGLTAATFADSAAVRVGQTVVAVGSPLGLDGTVTEGIVSALHRVTTGSSDNSAVIDALQTDAAINPGNSGGALVDLAGRVIGINQSIATAGSAQVPGQSSASGNIGIGFAIPANTAASVAEQLITSGKAVHAFLGVQTGGGSAQPGRSGSGQSDTGVDGATIASVEAGGPAAAAGLKSGDVVTKIDDRAITASDELVAAIRSYAPGDRITLTVRRGTATSTVTVTLGSDAAH